MQVMFLQDRGFFQITVAFYAVCTGKKWVENTGSKKKNIKVESLDFEF